MPLSLSRSWRPFWMTLETNASASPTQSLHRYVFAASYKVTVLWFVQAVKSMGFGARSYGILIPPRCVGKKIFRINQVSPSDGARDKA